MLKLSDEDIEVVEHFIRCDLLQKLEDRCSKNNHSFCDNDKKYFFGLYDSDTANFKFLLGERKLMKAAAKQVNDIRESRSFADFVSYFTMPDDYAICKSSTFKLSADIFFGKKERKNLKSQVTDVSIDMSSEVFAKVKPMLEKYAENGPLLPVRAMSKELIKIVNFGAGIRADVLCVFCTGNDQDVEALQKRIAVQCEIRGTKRYWNYSNLNSHLKRHIKNMKMSTDSQLLDEIADNNSASECIEIALSKSEEDLLSNLISSESNDSQPPEIIQQNQNETVHLVPNSKNLLYDQFSAQNLNLIETNMMNNEQQKVMVFKRYVDQRLGTVKVVRISGDGDCLFGACAHQLYRAKIDSDEHKNLVSELRQKVCEHINDNFGQFERVIKLRILEELEGKVIPASSIDEACKDFVEKGLSKPGFWGGSESCRAISAIFRANIVVFVENGPYYFATGFNREYERIIFLAYRKLNRKDANEEPDHYDSVSEIEQNVMYNCAGDLFNASANNTNAIIL